MEFFPSSVGCVIAGGSHSFGMISRSRECVIDNATTALTDQVMAVGNFEVVRAHMAETVPAGHALTVSG